MMTYAVAALAVFSLAQTLALARVYQRARGIDRLHDRLAQFTEALGLLTDTAEAGFTNVAAELEARRKVSRASSRTATAKRIATAVRRGKSLDEIMASEALSESEIRLHLGMARPFDVRTIEPNNRPAAIAHAPTDAAKGFRPTEIADNGHEQASGRSGQKVVPNGGLNFSTLDRWWAEAYDGLTGSAVGAPAPAKNRDSQEEVPCLAATTSH